MTIQTQTSLPQGLVRFECLQAATRNSVVFIFSQLLQIFCDVIVHPIYIIQNEYQKPNKLAFTYFTEPSIIVTSVWVFSFVCVEVLRPSQPNGVMSSAVSLPNHMFTGQA